MMSQNKVTMMVLSYSLGLFLAFSCYSETFRLDAECRNSVRREAMKRSGGTPSETGCLKSLSAVSNTCRFKWQDRGAHHEKRRWTISCAFKSQALERSAEEAHDDARKAFNQSKSFDSDHHSNTNDGNETQRTLARFYVKSHEEEGMKCRLNEMQAVETDLKQQREDADLHLREEQNAKDDESFKQIDPSSDTTQMFERHPVFDVE